ncbi:MAG TPA: hypothetical protein VGL36_35620 [Kribbella sp.]
MTAKETIVPRQTRTDLADDREDLMTETTARTVYVVNETGATYAFLDRGPAETFRDNEVAGGATEVTLVEAQAPAHLSGDELAEWCVEHVSPLGDPAKWTQQPTRGANNKWTCPECGNTSTFHVEVTGMVELTVAADGTITGQVDAEHLEWTQDSYAVCADDECNEDSIVDTFNPDRPRS